MSAGNLFDISRGLNSSSRSILDVDTTYLSTVLDKKPLLELLFPSEVTGLIGTDCWRVNELYTTFRRIKDPQQRKKSIEHWIAECISINKEFMFPYLEAIFYSFFEEREHPVVMATLGAINFNHHYGILLPRLLKLYYENNEFFGSAGNRLREVKIVKAITILNCLFVGFNYDSDTWQQEKKSHIFIDTISELMSLVITKKIRSDKIKSTLLSVVYFLLVKVCGDKSYIDNCVKPKLRAFHNIKKPSFSNKCFKIGDFAAIDELLQTEKRYGSFSDIMCYNKSAFRDLGFFVDWSLGKFFKKCDIAVAPHISPFFETTLEGQAAVPSITALTAAKPRPIKERKERIMSSKRTSLRSIRVHMSNIAVPKSLEPYAKRICIIIDLFFKKQTSWITEFRNLCDKLTAREITHNAENSYELISVANCNSICELFFNHMSVLHPLLGEYSAHSFYLSQTFCFKIVNFGGNTIDEFKVKSKFFENVHRMLGFQYRILKYSPWRQADFILKNYVHCTQWLFFLELTKNITETRVLKFLRILFPQLHTQKFVDFVQEMFACLTQLLSRRLNHSHKIETAADDLVLFALNADRKYISELSSSFFKRFATVICYKELFEIKMDNKYGTYQIRRV